MKPGRPKNSRNKKRAIAFVIPSSCPSCGSTKRKPYRQIVKVVEQDGERDGHAYNRVTWKRTQCESCGQYRIDRIFEKV